MRLGTDADSGRTRPCRPGAGGSGSRAWFAFAAAALIIAMADVARADCRSGCSVCPREVGPVVAVDAEIVRREGGMVHAIAVRSTGPAAHRVPAGAEIAFEIYALGDLSYAAREGNRVFLSAGWPEDEGQPVNWNALPLHAEEGRVDCYSFPAGGLAIDAAVEMALADDCFAAQRKAGWDTSCEDTVSACSASGGEASLLALLAPLLAWRRRVQRS